MRTEAEFEVVSFVPTETKAEPDITTALPVGVARIEKRFEGAVEGRAETIFTSAFDQAAGVGTYVAMESFEGTLDGRAGSFNFVHAATATGGDQGSDYFRIVPGSGTGELAGIDGDGGLTIEADGTHRIWFDYELG